MLDIVKKSDSFLPLPNEVKINAWVDSLAPEIKQYIKIMKMTALDLAEFYISVEVDKGKSMNEAFDSIYYEGAYEEFLEKVYDMFNI